MAIKKEMKQLYCNYKCYIRFLNLESPKKSYSCTNCGKETLRRKYRLSKNGRVFCSRSCQRAYLNKQRRWPEVEQRRRDLETKRKARAITTFYNKIKCVTTCCECGKEVRRDKRDLVKNKNICFCNRGCRMRYQIKHIIPKPRSKAEIFLSSHIATTFPSLRIAKNDRRTLKCGLEIDIFLPEINLAIELNGPCHYFTIYGEDSLKRVQRNDEIKQSEINSLGHKLIIVDISTLPTCKTQKFIEDYFISSLKPIIEELLTEIKPVI